MEQLPVVDALIVLDGQNPSFFAYMDHEEAQRIHAMGPDKTWPVHVRDSEERPLPQHLKDGLSQITDILVKMNPGSVYYLN